MEPRAFLNLPGLLEPRKDSYFSQNPQEMPAEFGGRMVAYFFGRD